MQTESRLSCYVPGESPLKSDVFSSPRKRSVVLSLLLILITLAVYNSVSHNGFINLDDNLYVTENTNIQHGLHWSTVKWASTSVEQANWHPLTWLSHALDWQLFKTNAGGHHSVSVLFHAINAVLLFLLLQSATGFTWRSMAVATLFALHPVNVESVAWVAERKNVLSMMFFLLAMLAYGWYARQPSLRRYGLVGLTFTFALMAKPQVITLPFVLLLWDYWPLERFGPARAGAVASNFSRRSFRWLALEKVPLLILSAADAVITMYAQREGNAVRDTSDYSLHARLGNAVVSYARYVCHCFWPIHLSPTYSHHADNIPGLQVAASGLFLLTLTALILLSRKRYLLVGWLWFLGTLVPMIGIVQVGDQAMADRYAYITFIGLFWMAVWGLSEIASEWHISPRWLAVPACLALMATAVLSHRLVGYWHDSEALWDYAISVDQQDFLAHCNRGRILVAENRPEEAIPEFIIAERLHRYPLSEVLRFADYEIRHGYSEDAAARCRKVLQLTQDSHLRSIAWTDLGIANVTLDNLSEAASNFDSALQVDPKNAAPLIGMGIVAERNGAFEFAVDYFSRAVQIRPSDLGFYFLGTALAKSGRQEEANAAYSEAQRASPDMNEALKLAHLLLP
jgi:protein O-mannosyl-transferase